MLSGNLRVIGLSPSTRESGRPTRAAASNCPGFTLLRFLLPSASLFPGAPSWTRLPPPSGSVFRFSQPPGGLRCPGTSRSCLIPITLVGFTLQSFSLPEIRSSLEAVAPLWLKCLFWPLANSLSSARTQAQITHPSTPTLRSTQPGTSNGSRPHTWLGSQLPEPRRGHLLRFEALLLLEVRSRRRTRVPACDCRCSPGLLPL